jgi:opacity protein-like surface antigen
MKNHYSIGLAGVCAGAVCLAANAQSNPNQANGGTTTVVTPPLSYYSYTPRAYVGADLGGVVTRDVSVKEFFGPISNTKVHLDPGFRVGFVGGYQFADWFSLEGETGIMANTIDSIDGANINGFASLNNVPLLANVRLQLPPHRFPLSPYIGGGVGGSVSIIDFDRNIALNGVTGSGSDSSLVFAYQAFAGLRWAINNNMGIGVEYHYFVTTGPEWTFNSFDTTTDHIRFSGVQSHAASVAFDFHF